MADGGQPLSQLELTPVTDHVNTLYLRLPSREDPRLRKVRLALSFFPGEENVVLYFEDCKKRVGSRCAIRPSLLQDLRERLGEENVVAKYTTNSAPAVDNLAVFGRNQELFCGKWRAFSQGPTCFFHRNMLN